MIGGVGPFQQLLFLAQDAAPDAAAGGSFVVIFVGIAGALATLGTALGPTFIEILKNRGARNAPAPAPEPPAAAPTEAVATPSVAVPVGAPTGTPIETAYSGITMLEQAIFDARAQRDDAMNRYFAISEELEQARAVIGEQAVIIARWEAAANNNRNSTFYGRHGMPGPQQNWPPR